jgi:hypothetical protein
LYSFEIKYLTSRKYGWYDFVFFCGSQYENGIGWWFFQRLQKGIECLGTQHMYLIYDEYFVGALLWLKPHLLNECTDVFYTVVGGGIEFKYIERGTFIKRLAGSAYITWLCFFFGVFAVDDFGQDTGTGGLTYTSGSCEKKCMRQLIGLQCIFQSAGNMVLTYHFIKSDGSVFSC